MYRIIIGIIICICIFGAGFGTNYLINRGRTNDLRTTITQLGELDIERRIEIDKVKESNTRLRREAAKYRDEITGLYRQLREGIGMAETQVEELGHDFQSMAIQISGIIKGIRAVRSTFDILKNWIESRDWIQPGMVSEEFN